MSVHAGIISATIHVDYALPCPLLSIEKPAAGGLDATSIIGSCRNFFQIEVLFFSCDCLMASMARSVECLIQNILDTVQVHLIGAAPIVQVKKVRRKIGPFLQKSHQKQANSKQGTARHRNQEPPGQAPRYTGQEATPQHNRDFEHRSRHQSFVA